MGHIFKPKTTKPLPAGARIERRGGKRVACWTDRRGKDRAAPVNEDGTRIVRQSRVWFARFRDGAGKPCTKSTGCHDKQNATKRLVEFQDAAGRIERGTETQTEVTAAECMEALMEGHIDDYLSSMKAAGLTIAHRGNVERQLQRIVADCSFKRLRDFERGRFEQWLTGCIESGMSARTRNSYLTAVNTFANWCVNPDVGRMLRNPFAGIVKLNEKAGAKRRRAMTEDEARRLLAVARQRPLDEASTVRKGPRHGERYAELLPKTRARLERLGWERQLIYKSLMMTGLRKGELASLTVGQLHLDGLAPFARLDAGDDKAGEEREIPLRDDLAADLREWLHAGGKDASSLVFTVPDKLSKIFNRDLAAAGIAKRDERGRVLDVHALRHTFGTWLSVAGVSPRTAQAAMRHSKMELTMNVYTDPKMMDVARAVETLPTLIVKPVDCTTVFTTAPTGNLRAFEGIAGVMSMLSELGIKPMGSDVTSSGDSGKGLLSTFSDGPSKMGATGLEPVTPSVSSRGNSKFDMGKDRESVKPADCTTVNTTAESNLDALADAIRRGLPEADRAALIANLTASQ